jgi:nucleoside diphosphate kinase
MHIVPPPDRALTVYSPDAVLSGLVGALDRFIAEATGLVPDGRGTVVHDARSIEAFYGLSGGTGGRHWPLVVDLFDGRAACVTEWRGADPLARLQRIKGATQPARAEAGTVRSRFWCDNPVCNLIHVSDTYPMMAEEAEILWSRRTAAAFVAPDCGPDLGVRHSGLLTFARLAARQWPEHGLPDLPADGDARETGRRLVAWLIGLSAREPAARDLVDAFLAGEEPMLPRIRRAFGRIGSWEALLLECAQHSNPLWVAAASGPAYAAAAVS